MRVELRMGSDVILDIFKQSQNDGDAQWSTEAKAPDFSIVNEWRKRLWETITNAIETVAQEGKGVIKEWLDKIDNQILEVRKELGEQSEIVLSSITEQFLACRQTTWETMLELLPQELNVHEETVTLSEIGLECEIAVGSELMVVLPWILEVTAGGTLVVSAKYS